MIRSFYHHGMEQPATELTPEQMRAALGDAGGVLWVDLLDPSPEEARRVLTEVFGFHPLGVEACLSDRQPVGPVNFGRYLFMTLHIADGSPSDQGVTIRQVSCYVGSNFLVTHHRRPVPLLDRLAERVMQDEHTMDRGAILLTYELLTAAGEDYDQLLNVLLAAEAGLEVETLAAPRPDTLHRLLRLRRNTLKLRRALQFHASTLDRLASEGLRLIPGEHRIYFQELSGRGWYLVRTAEYLYELIGGAVGMHLVTAVHETNRSLKRIGALGIMFLAAVTIVGLGVIGLPSALSIPMPAMSVTLGSILVVGAVLAVVFYVRGWL